MKKRVIFIILLVLLVACQNPKSSQLIGNDWPTQGWRSDTPESQGMDAAILAKGAEYIEQNNLALHSLLIIRHGVIVSETYFSPYQADTLHEQYSVTKSFTSTAVGMALDQGKLQDVDQKVLDFFPGQAFANMDARKESMRIRDLLTMTSGLGWVEGDTTFRAMYMSSDWVKFVLDLPTAADPGSEFLYCSGCSHVLSAIVQQGVGQNLRDFLQANLFKPLGIAKYTWEDDAQGISIGGWGLSMAPRDMAKLGYLYLHKGQWEGQQIVSQEWVEAATQKQVPTEGENGYGYQWWVFPELGGYAALGLYGQTVFVAPEQDLIVVTTAGMQNHDAIFGLIQDFILKAIQAP
jgi:CubicO group peptidase (beta-lactamase class C family)